jgi:hypothetical protein
MNKKRYLTGIIVLSALIASLFISCSDDFFETQTDDRISPDQHYNSYIDADLSTLGCFTLLDGVAEGMVLVDGLQSDQLTVTENADNDMIALNMHQAFGVNAYLDPSNFYKIIMNVNEVLPNLEQIIAVDRDFDSLTYTSYMGSLITLRSWTYFNLFKLYGKVTLMNTNVNDLDLTKAPVYITDKNTLIDTLLADLLPFYDSLDRYRFNIDHYVLMGELYLEKGDYASAASLLKWSLDGSAYNVSGLRGQYMMITSRSQKELWQEMFKEYNDITATTIRSWVPYSLEAGHKNNIEEWMNYNYTYMVKPTSAVIDSFTTDIPSKLTGDVFRGIRISYDTVAGGIPYVKKYSLDAGSKPFSADIILYRDADIHLMLAEALNRSVQTTTAFMLLNDGFKAAKPKPSGFTTAMWSQNMGVRGRAYLKNKTVPASIVADPVKYVKYVEDLIIKERGQELAFEGKRWFDLKRIAERRDDPAYLLDKVCAKFDNPADSAAVRANIGTDMSKWYLPLP